MLKETMGLVQQHLDMDSVVHLTEVQLYKCQIHNGLTLISSLLHFGFIYKMLPMKIHWLIQDSDIVQYYIKEMKKHPQMFLIEHLQFYSIDNLKQLVFLFQLLILKAQKVNIFYQYHQFHIKDGHMLQL